MFPAAETVEGESGREFGQVREQRFRHLLHAGESGKRGGIQLRLQFGIRNLSDKQPPILYLNNVTNANTDVNTYDTLGRQWWLSLNQKF